jgi:hypothetical protein
VFRARRGAYASSRTLGTECGGRCQRPHNTIAGRDGLVSDGRRAGRGWRSRTAKSCGLGAPTPALSLAKMRGARPGDEAQVVRKATVADKPGSPRRAGDKPLKPSRREGRASPVGPVVTAACISFCTRAAVQPERSSLRPRCLRGADYASTRARRAAGVQSRGVLK